MKKEVILFIILLGLVNAGLSFAGPNEGTPDPDTSSPEIIIVETYDAQAEYPEGLTFDGSNYLRQDEFPCICNC
ncbi:hypothetical protein CMO92_04685 [Candidatus Woesearchaeota archaeon]|nr:hypothetical protein [Candidatus Woesearchaeota archaeon]|tara:strand:- start:1161 stop:1382 length:222 start_codon:yes stop_codon:yes gene_type:complete